MEVMERPLDADDARWNELVKGAGLDPEAAPDGAEEIPLSVALGEPQDLEDLWPGHIYIPPKIKHLRELFPLARAMSEKYDEGETLEALLIGCRIIHSVARRADGSEVALEEIEATFDEEEVAALIHHIMTREGLWVEDGPKNAAGGRRGKTGAKSFHSSVAASAAIPSTPAEN